MSDRYWDALEARQAALSFVDGPRWDWYAGNIERDLVEDRSNHHIRISNPSVALDNFRLVSSSGLRHGPTFWWSPEMCGALDVLRRSLPDNPLDLSELVSQAGFFYYSNPIRLGASDKYIVATSWIVTAEDGQETRFQWVYPGNETGVIVVHYCRPPMGYLVPTTMSPWTAGETIDQHYKNTQVIAGSITGQVMEEGLYTEVEMLQLFMAGQVFVQQRVASRERAEVPRATARRLEREKNRVEDSTVQVVSLRRPSTSVGTASDGVPRSVDWDHRWWVGLSTAGFWRNQPTKDGYKRILIAPFVKGPEGKPLVTRGAVNVVVR